MKMKSYFCFLFSIFFFLLGFYLFYSSNEKMKNDIKKLSDFIYESSNIFEVIVDRNNVYDNYSKKYSSISKSLKRKEFNDFVKEIELIVYDDIKVEFSSKLESLEKKILEEEKRILKYSSLENIKGSVSAFTAYCSDGCNGYTASGKYIGNGNIYYYDKDYGKVRIVAGDKSYPFGTIVRFNNLGYFGKEVYAIVLDRGGAIGKNKRRLFDLLFLTEKEANNFGVAKNVSCDILRLGY